MAQPRGPHVVTLREAVLNFIPSEVQKSIHKAVVFALCARLVRKWNYAASKYRVDHPGKALRPCTHLLPAKVARMKMATWIPWAIYVNRIEMERLATMFKALTDEQVREIDAEPEADSDDEDDNE